MVTSHSTQKPTEVFARAIRNHTGDVYEPFSGSGSCLIAAEQLGRRCYATEIEPKYVQMAIERWQAYHRAGTRSASDGAPLESTEGRIEALVIALGTGCNREAAARHAGIDRTTLYRWVERDQAIRARVEKAEADVEVRLAAQIVQAAPVDWRAAAWVARTAASGKLWAGQGCRGSRHSDDASTGTPPARRPDARGNPRAGAHVGA